MYYGLNSVILSKVVKDVTNERQIHKILFSVHFLLILNTIFEW